MKSLEQFNIEAYVSEFIGTFFLVLTIGINGLQNTALAPISVGLVLMAMICSTGKVSGAHFNPAVTLGVWLVGPKLATLDACVYVVAQLCGGLAAGCTYRALLGATLTFQPGHGYGMTQVVAVEVLFAAALVLVVLGVCAAERDNPRVGNQFGGLAIGFTVMAAAFAVGSVSGCSINPAVAFGVMVSNYMHVRTGMNHFFWYLVSPLMGSLLAAGFFWLLSGTTARAQSGTTSPQSGTPRKGQRAVGGASSTQAAEGAHAPAAAPPRTTAGTTSWPAAASAAPQHQASGGSQRPGRSPQGQRRTPGDVVSGHMGSWGDQHGVSKA